MGRQADPEALSGGRLREREGRRTVAHPGRRQPYMGNVSADGKFLWLSGRYDDVVYRFDTGGGTVTKIKVGPEPHGLTVWPSRAAIRWGTPAIFDDRYCFTTCQTSLKLSPVLSPGFASFDQW